MEKLSLLSVCSEKIEENIHFCSVFSGSSGYRKVFFFIFKLLIFSLYTHLLFCYIHRCRLILESFCLLLNKRMC